MKKILLTLIIMYVLYDVIGPFIGDFFLKRNGVCTKAILTSATVRVRYHKGELKYHFIVNGVTYEGNSLESDKSRVGDSICVIYMESKVSTNRPVKYFNDSHLPKCNCK
ncbi:hypothetical protein HQN83_05640 [Pedobacter sp. LMG 31643]|uniref:hypothetical protein n=1 Tax=Pedobacter foliorum TaxID=2739058 RepID=UPI001566BA10|nr:hypothetical protein [Pedobacter foliorum]NRF38186.1 hypothetical protein [Pedobacter foliorum]